MFSSDEIHRYRRQLQLSGWGEAGQQRLRDSRVLVIGVGGLGNIVAPYLAGAGVGQLVLADGDQVDIANLHRQWLYDEGVCRRNKAEVAAKRLTELNSYIDIEAVPNHLSGEALAEQISWATLVLDCSDNLSTRLAVNQACRRFHKPLVSAAGIRREGQVTTFDFNRCYSPCLSCMYPAGQHQQADCNHAGVFGPALGILASWQAGLALRYLVGEGLPHGALWWLDMATLQWQRMQVTTRDDCPTCGSGHESLPESA